VAIRVQSARLLDPLSHVGLAMAQHLAEDPAGGRATPTDDRPEVAEDPPVRPEELLDAACAAGLLCRTRQSADHRWQRRVHRLLRGRRIRAELLAYLLDLLRPEMLLDQIESGSHVAHLSWRARVTRYDARDIGR